MSLQPRTRAEEFVHTVTHGIGLALSVIGAIALIARAISPVDPWRVAGCCIFALTLIAVYAASTLSHCIHEPWLNRVFRTLDQACIYLLIAGTYTPFALEYLRFGWWWLVLALIWSMALGGLVSKVLFSHRIDAATAWSYLVLGWIPIAFAREYIGLIPSTALWWVMIGGLCYTIGTIFLVVDYRRWHFHGIWHLWVMAGSGCHFFAIFAFVASAPLHRIT